MATELPLVISATIQGHEQKFLIDTGSTVSILPLNSHYLPFLRPSGISLRNVSGKPIPCHGEIDVELIIPRARRCFNFTFVVADVIQPILGIDFLIEHALLVDAKNKLLIDSTTGSIIKLNNGNQPHVTFFVDFNDIDKRVVHLISQYPNLTSPLQLAKNVPVATKVFHRIDTGNHPPISCKPRPLTGRKLQAGKAEFQYLMNSGRARRSESNPWGSPSHFVPKKDPDEERMVGDYRRLNSITVPDKYPIPHLRSLTMSLHKKKVFSKVDLQRAYLQIPVAPEDIQKTAIVTSFGQFEYLFMPYGLKNAGCTFQRYMDTLFSNVDNVFVYIDDILIASETEEQHIHDLNKVFKILSDNNLRVKTRKCEFFKQSLTFLGYDVSADGIRPPADRINAITSFPLPTLTSDLRRFIGMMNFFRQMIPHFAEIAFPVTELLRLAPPGKMSVLQWTDTAKESFNNLKQALASCPTLSFPSPETSQYQLVTDSSNFAIGAALYQMIDNVPHPISFFSKKLSTTQRSLSTFDRELHAAYSAILHFKYLIDGHHVTLFTDHKPLVTTYHSNSNPKSDCQQRKFSLISEYIADIQYIRGQDNVVADCLSRPICAVTPAIFDLPALANAQKDDPELDQFKDRLTEFPMSNNLSIWCDKSTHVPRPFVPKQLRRNVIQFVHDLSHPGFKTTSKLVKDRYFWPSIDSEIKDYVRTCINCQQGKVSRHTKSLVEPISTPTDRFQTVHIDIVGPLPPASLPNYPYPLPFRYLLTCIDRATRWSESIPLTDTTASSVAIAFISGWISRFGVPLEVVTDRGSQFQSEFFANLSSIIGFHHIRTTSYNPRANGIIERFHRTLKASIMCRQENWYQSLPLVMLGLRMSPNSLQFSPFTAVTGSFMSCPHPIIDKTKQIVTSNETIEQFVKDMQSINFYDFSSGDCHASSTPHIPKELDSSSHVWLRTDRVKKSLEAPYTGPYKVLQRQPKFFIIQLPQGDTSVSIDRLKPAFLPAAIPTTSPPVDPPAPSSEDNAPLTPAPLPSPPSTSLPSVSPTQPPPTTRSGRTVRFNMRPEYQYF